MSFAPPALLLSVVAADTPTTTAGTGQLVVAAVVGIAAIVLMITWAKLHPFLALMVGAALLAVLAGVSYVDAFTSFTTGFGSTIGGVGLLIVLGAIVGSLLISSGGADAIVDAVLDRTPVQRLPWALALIGFVVGIPLFFEVGVVILIPVVMIVARRAKQPLILLGLPALAGLSALHGLVPPHPGPLIAIDALGANLGLTLGLGLLVAIPSVTIAGPVLARYAARWVPIEAPGAVLGAEPERPEGARRPSVGVALTVVLLPVALMLLRTVVELSGQEEAVWGKALVFVGTPLEALLITTFVALALLGTALGRSRAQLATQVSSALGPIAGIVLIVGAGGGFKQTLVDTGVGSVIANGISDSTISPLLAGWLVAVLIRLATGSATVATVTASGIMAPLAGGLTDSHTALLVLAIGAGSVFLSHVNDAGFWLVKEYFGMSVGQTFKTWSLMETVLSVTALVFVLLLGLVV